MLIYDAQEKNVSPPCVHIMVLYVCEYVFVYVCVCVCVCARARVCVCVYVHAVIPNNCT
jgi:hypothetical protein